MGVLPDEEQDTIASLVLDLLGGSSEEEEAEWENLVRSPASQAWIDKQAQSVFSGVDTDLYAD